MIKIQPDPNAEYGNHDGLRDEDENEVEMEKGGESVMKYLGQWMETYMLCPANSFEAQIKCLHYAPFDRIDRYCKWYDGNTCTIYEEKK